MPTSQRPRAKRAASPTACPWKGRVWAEFRGGQVTRAERDALLTLATYRGAGGLATPSHATIADRAKVGARTVQRALDTARNLGLIVSRERRRRNGWRWLRTSDEHRLTVPLDPVQKRQEPRYRRIRTTRQPGEGGESQESKKLQMATMLAEAARLPDLLAMRRALFERRVSE